MSAYSPGSLDAFGTALFHHNTLAVCTEETGSGSRITNDKRSGVVKSLLDLVCP
jgi:hypothetical protein